MAIIIVAAGSGTRLGATEPKAFVDVAGRTILERALRSALSIAEPAQIVVVAPAERLEQANTIVARAAGAASSSLTVVSGGDTRQQSVAAGLAVLGDGIEIVLVHDSARSLTPPTLIEAVIAGVRSSGNGVIPGLPVADTIKQVDWMGSVERTVDRAPLVAVQTPQGFPRAALVDAYKTASDDFTDDAALVAAAGLAVTVIDGDPLAFKITTPWDLARAESLVAASPAAPSWRTGVGIDVHSFDADAPLWLGGLHWPGEPGLAGHSDGDALAHAVCDSLLSAAGLGDIGATFGTDDPRFENAHGDVFLTATVELVRAAGFEIGNVSVQLVGNRPKVAPRRAEMEAHLSEVLGAPVSVSATTTDGLGFTGRGEGISAVATALVYKP
ncbi:2-C-methyl-D-erythritol 4-phosphate cytidylyltransferase [Glaciihabitans arcticus]|uniref:Bifunctional enzyme IspD/IspF n=1 Tax=Glaciihabitans arcticus TaxID=2668039 RepID=A0A4Q9GZ55_9MICO|nr:2-C-methyl-D-erythritol 4-phosphate cytidylyltransferase [Glaciihabitans arcticus]TBN57650.1 2-C-methyl-D-erythritol 4-phosphate cytidylyltransferase [Glaciihabitans arcticus]